MTARLLAVVALSAAITSCMSYDDYREYRAVHPGWEPTFPRDVIAIDELLAIVHAPPEGRNTTLIITHEVVLGLGREPWEEIPLKRIRAGAFAPDPGRLYVVAARAQCLWSVAFSRNEEEVQRAAGSFVWYMLRDDRLLAYDHTRFLEKCETLDLVKGSVQNVPGFEETLRERLAE